MDKDKRKGEDHQGEGNLEDTQTEDAGKIIHREVEVGQAVG